MSQDIKAQLAALKKDAGINPDASWVKENRAALLARVRETARPQVDQSFASKVNESVAVVLPSRMYVAVRSFAVLFLVLTVGVGGWLGSASAAQKSLPGDFFYNVKLASEKTQKVVAKVTGNEKASVQLSLDSASRRADEIKQIAVNKPEHVAKTAERLKKEVEEVKKNVEKMKEKDPKGAVEIAKTVTERAEEINAHLDGTDDEESKEKGTEQQEADKEETKKQVKEVKRVVEDIELEAVKVVITLEENDQEVKEFVEGFVEDKVHGILRTEPAVDGAIMNTSTQESDVSASSSQAVTSEGTEEDLGGDKAPVSEEKVKQVEEVAGEVLKLVEGDQLDEAVEKIKELNTLKEDEEEEPIGEDGEGIVPGEELPTPLVPNKESSSTASVQTETVVQPAPAETTSGTEIDTTEEEPSVQ